MSGVVGPGSRLPQVGYLTIFLQLMVLKRWGLRSRITERSDRLVRREPAEERPGRRPQPTKRPIACQKPSAKGHSTAANTCTEKTGVSPMATQLGHSAYTTIPLGRTIRSS